MSCISDVVTIVVFVVSAAVLGIKFGCSTGTHAEIMKRYRRKGFGPVMLLDYDVKYWSTNMFQLEEIIIHLVS